MSTNKQGQQPTQDNAGEQPKQDSSSEIHTREEIEGTPFVIVGNEERGYMLTTGDHMVSEYQPTVWEAKQLLETEKWNIITNLMIVVYKKMQRLDTIDELKKLNNIKNKTTL